MYVYCNDDVKNFVDFRQMVLDGVKTNVIHCKFRKKNICRVMSITETNHYLVNLLKNLCVLDLQGGKNIE